MQSIDLAETYTYGTSKYLICNKHDNIIKEYKNVSIWLY